MNPSVSIGIPTFNRAGLLRQAIQSILQQTFQDFEIIVSDDCSTDDTASVVADVHDSRIRYQRTAKNLRPPRNWNACARLARGDLFALLPDDDVYCPDFLRTMVSALERDPAIGFAQCGYYSADENLRPIQTVLASPTPISLTGESALLWQCDHLSCIPASVLFRRSLAAQLGWWREDYWDDWAFILRVAFRHGFTFVPQALAVNRVHSRNLNRVLYGESRDPILDLINQQADVFGAALPTTPRLIALRAKFNRQLSCHCILLALGALRRRDWVGARFHWTRARQLNALAGMDLGWVGLWRELRVQARQAAEQRQAAQTRAPVVCFEEGR